MDTRTNCSSFYTRHFLFHEAVSYVLSAQLEPTMFVDHVLKACVDTGEMNKLQEVFAAIDPTLEKVQPLINATTKFLRANMSFNLLYKFLVFARNHAGAALTCVRLFGFATEPSARLGHLQKARVHFQDALTEVRSARTSGGGEESEGLSETELTKNLNTVELQLEVTKWFSVQMPSRSMSLFGTHKMKCDVAEILLPHNFPLAQRIMVDFRLPHVQICCTAINSLARSRQISKVNEILGNLKGKLSDKDWDHVVSGVIEVFARELNEAGISDRFIKYLKGDRAKFEACIACNKLKTAYQLAIKQQTSQALQDVGLVKSKALSKLQDNKDDSGLGEVVKWCNRYLAANPKANP